MSDTPTAPAASGRKTQSVILGYGTRDPQTKITTIRVEGIGVAPTLVQLVHNERRGDTSDKAPTHRALVGDVEVGAFWARKQQGTNVTYLSGELRSVLFPGWVLRNVQVWEITEGAMAGSRRMVALPPLEESATAPTNEAPDW